MNRFALFFLAANAGLLLAACDDSVDGQSQNLSEAPACSQASEHYLIDSPDTCAAARFTCDAGSSPFFDDCGCGCEPDGPTCDIADGATYVIEDAQQCLAAFFTCDDGYAPFFDDCGCGCQPEPEPSCDPPDGAAYVIEDAQQCLAAFFTCDDGYAPFFDDCGCGCQPQ
jgi:hypothetical protein